MSDDIIGQLLYQSNLIISPGHRQLECTEAHKRRRHPADHTSWLIFDVAAAQTDQNKNAENKITITRTTVIMIMIKLTMMIML
jgi:hypothetical protein